MASYQNELPDFKVSRILATDDHIAECLERAGWERDEVHAKTRQGNVRNLFTAYWRKVPRPDSASVAYNAPGFPDLVSGTPISEFPQLVGDSQLLPPQGEVGNDCVDCVDVPPGPPALIPSGTGALATVTHMGEIRSIQLMRGETRPSFQLAFDTEFYYEGGERYVLSYQFAFADPADSGTYVEVIIAPLGSRLSLIDAVSWMIGRFELHNLPFCGFSGDGIAYKQTRRILLPYRSGKKVHVKVVESLEDAESFISEKWPDGDCPYSLKISTRTDSEGKHRSVCKVSLSDLGLHWAGTAPATLRQHFCVLNGKLERSVESLAAHPEPLELGYINDFSDAHKLALEITLVCHAAQADLTTLDFSGGERDLLVRCSQVQGGLVSLHGIDPVHAPVLDKYWRFYPLRFAVRDTMCYAPAGKKSLAALGEVVGVEKVKLSANAQLAVVRHVGLPDEDASEELAKSHMNVLLEVEPEEYCEYASEDAVVCLAYVEELWGASCSLPVTLTSATTKVAKDVMDEYYKATTADYAGFDETYRGLRKISAGGIWDYERAAYIENTKLEPVSADAGILQNFAQAAYHGGLNACTEPGYFSGVETIDIDSKNAYPTVMSLVPDPDWVHPDGVIQTEIVRRDLTFQDLAQGPFTLLFAYVTFEFPASVRYPCIPVQMGSSLYYPRTSEGLDGVHAAAPELYLALKLGARVHVKRGYVARYKLVEDNTGQTTAVSCGLRQAVTALVRDRDLAARSFGKKSLPAQTLKTGANSIYGKTAQDVIEKSTWDAYNEEMVGLGGSAITSPVHACMTTSGCRALLMAAMNELDVAGYRTFSVTTDGFITDAPEELMEQLDLYGLRPAFVASRRALTGKDDPDVWEVKHRQVDLLNFSTRGNVSLNTGDPDDKTVLPGVCAHNSYVTGADSDSYEDRALLTHEVLSREGRVHTVSDRWTSFRKLSAKGSERRDFKVYEIGRNLHMDFDLKRRPVRASMRTVHPSFDDPAYLDAVGVDAPVTYEMVCFETEPYESLAEAELYRSVADSIRSSGHALRTEADWVRFWALLSNRISGGKQSMTDPDWSMLLTCVRGHRLTMAGHSEYWQIPMLANPSFTVDEKLDWINGFNVSGRRFKKSDWDNCCKRSRASSMLPREEVCDLLDEMGAVFFDEIKMEGHDE